jgi:hypothetical protein
LENFMRIHYPKLREPKPEAKICHNLAHEALPPAGSVFAKGSRCPRLRGLPVRARTLPSSNPRVYATVRAAHISESSTSHSLPVNSTEVNGIQFVNFTEYGFFSRTYFHHKECAHFEPKNGRRQNSKG